MATFHEFPDYILYSLIKNSFKMSARGKTRGLGLKKVLDRKIWSTPGTPAVEANKSPSLFAYCLGLLALKSPVADLPSSKLEQVPETTETVFLLP